MDIITGIILRHYCSIMNPIIKDNNICNIINDFNLANLSTNYYNTSFFENNQNFYKFKYKLNVIYLIYLYYLEENNEPINLNDIKKTFVDFENKCYSDYYKYKDKDEDEDEYEDEYEDIKFTNNNNYNDIYNFLKENILLSLKLIRPHTDYINNIIKKISLLSENNKKNFDNFISIINRYETIYRHYDNKINDIFKIFNDNNNSLYQLNTYLQEEYKITYLDFFAKIIPFFYFIEKFNQTINVTNIKKLFEFDYENDMYKFYDTFKSYKYSDNYIPEEIEPEPDYSDEDFEAIQIDEDEDEEKPDHNIGGKKKKKKKRLLKKYKK